MGSRVSKLDNHCKHRQFIHAHRCINDSPQLIDIRNQPKNHYNIQVQVLYLIFDPIMKCLINTSKYGLCLWSMEVIAWLEVIRTPCVNSMDKTRTLNIHTHEYLNISVRLKLYILMINCMCLRFILKLGRQLLRMIQT